MPSSSRTLGFPEDQSESTSERQLKASQEAQSFHNYHLTPKPINVRNVTHVCLYR
ncbi:hypothetical protein EXN66_Car019039 [Channa argus]|uniref:Uncharacterized protein n=1 Tax=Channa argus TaxID=215402 RepID=A0A6G1QKZ8_CHAAH|nr:hypothetical protein EXN66_Car019039 [Channa argus]